MFLKLKRDNWQYKISYPTTVGVGNNMLSEECDDISRLLNKSLSKYKKHLMVINNYYYIYVVSPANEQPKNRKIITIIHGYGTPTEPYNIKFLPTKRDLNFFTFEKFKSYIENEFYIDLVTNIL